jgi:hypothetical protein
MISNTLIVFGRQSKWLSVYTLHALLCEVKGSDQREMATARAISVVWMSHNQAPWNLPLAPEIQSQGYTWWLVSHPPDLTSHPPTLNKRSMFINRVCTCYCPILLNINLPLV